MRAFSFLNDTYLPKIRVFRLVRFRLLLRNAEREDPHRAQLRLHVQELPQIIPDAYIETAEYDILRDEGILYGKKLEAAGARVEINETARTFHGYDASIDSKITRMNIEKRIAFLKRTFS